MRIRATQAQMEERYDAIIEMVGESRPTSVRHLYYQAITRHLVEKDTKDTKRSNYGKVQRAVLHLRREGLIEYGDIVDSTRWMRKPTSYSSAEEALDHWQAAYRRDLWAGNGTRLEVWCESESIAGVLISITAKWDVPLLPCHGYSSETFAWGAAESWADDEREPAVLYVGDLDLHGKQIEADLHRKLEGFYGEEVAWSRVGITEEQVEEYELQDLATKTGHWEAEALPPDILRAELEDWIEIHAPVNALEVNRAVEESEREGLAALRAVYSARPVNGGAA